MKEKKSGARAEQKTSWKYFAVMNFPESLVKERPSCSNMSPSLENRPSSRQATSAPLPASSPGTSFDAETVSLYLIEVFPNTLTISSPLATESTLPEPSSLPPVVF